MTKYTTYQQRWYRRQLERELQWVDAVLSGDPSRSPPYDLIKRRQDLVRKLERQRAS